MLGSPQVAIVGLACRFPGAANLQAFWAMLCAERSALGAAPRTRGLPAQAPRWGGFLTDPTRFDAAFFGMTHAEVIACAPEQRLALEVVQDALDDAGLIPATLGHSHTGVFACGGKLLRGALPLAPRLAQLHDWRGPSVGVEAGGVSTHLGVHLAAQSLLRGECAQAVVVAAALLRAGAVDRWLGPASVLSMRGRGAVLDASADGTVWGEGAGCLVLKSLAAAQADGDAIYALLRGSAVQHQGARAAQQAQAEVIRAAYANAHLPLQAAHYVEVHGHGWPHADRLEVCTLSSVLAHGRLPEAPLWLGTVKNNVGHLGVASGMASLIKVALALQQQSMPRTVHVVDPVELSGLQLAPAGAPVGVASVCGASALGQHAHLLLSAAPPPLSPSLGDFGGTRLLPLSAASPAALRALVQRHLQALEQAPMPPLVDWCYTASTARPARPVRLAATGRNRGEMLASLRAAQIATPRAPPPLVWAFSDVAPRPAHAAWSLALQQPVFRRALEEVAAALQAAGGPALAPELRRLGSAWMQASPALAQPLLFALQVALAHLWRSWDIQPARLWGWGVGELAAAHLAGALSLPDATQVVWERSQLFAALAHFAPGRAKVKVAARLSERLRRLRPQATRVPFWAGSSTAPTPGKRLDADYWGAQAATVAARPHTSVHDPAAVLHLSPYTDTRLPMALHSLAAHQDAATTLQKALGQLWVLGINPSWDALYPEPHARVHLPAYPWQGDDHAWESANDGEAVAPVAQEDSPRPLH